MSFKGSKEAVAASYKLIASKRGGADPNRENQSLIVGDTWWK